MKTETKPGKTVRNCNDCANRTVKKAGKAAVYEGICNQCIQEQPPYSYFKPLRRLASIVALLAVFAQTSCATNWKVGSTRDRMKAVHVLPMKDGAAVAVDPTNWDAFWEALRTDTMGTLGCVALDTVFLAGTVIGVEKFGEANGYWGKSTSKQNAPSIPGLPSAPSVGHDNNQFVVPGSYNTFNLYPVITAP